MRIPAFVILLLFVIATPLEVQPQTAAGTQHAKTAAAPAKSKPLSGIVRAIDPPPKVSRKELAGRVADLSITLTGGEAGSPAKATFSVVLNTAVTTEGTAELIDEAEPSRRTPATRTRNGYVFKNVEFAQPGPAAARVFRITNVRVNASGIGGGSASGSLPVQALITISNPRSRPIHLSHAKQVVALVPRLNKRVDGQK